MIPFSELLQQAVNEPGLISRGYSQFRTYSLGNQLLALAQCLQREIQPGPIATYQRWKELGRYVRKGEKAITLCRPVTVKKTKTGDDGTPEETAATWFVYKNYWFVFAQTEGRELEPLTHHRHMRGPLVLCRDAGTALTRQMVQSRVKRAAVLAEMANVGVHILRHTFCSHLAMRGAPARAIQELAGHTELLTTQRYMHLSQAALDSAIRLLETGGVLHSRGDILEEKEPAECKALKLERLNWR